MLYELPNLSFMKLILQLKMEYYCLSPVRFEFKIQTDTTLHILINGNYIKYNTKVRCFKK